MRYVFSFVHSTALAFFVAVKVAGVSFAAWSWWWLLMPEVPALGLLVARWNL